MGDLKGQKSYADLFEKAVEKYLHANHVRFVTQKQQITEMRENKRNRQITPDFIFTNPAIINDKKL